MESLGTFQVMRYGYSIFDYCRQYDQEWTDSVAKLMGMLNLSTENNKAIEGSSKYDHLKKYSRQSNSIPIDSIYEIIAYLDERGLSRVSLVCKQWNTLANSHEIWNNLLLKKFCVRFDSIKMKNPFPRSDDDKTNNGKAKRRVRYSQHVDTMTGTATYEQQLPGQQQQQQLSGQQQQIACAKTIFKEMSQAFDDLRRLNKKVHPLKSNTAIYLGYSLYQ